MRAGLRAVWEVLGEIADPPSTFLAGKVFSFAAACLIGAVALVQAVGVEDGGPLQLLLSLMALATLGFALLAAFGVFARVGRWLAARTGMPPGARFVVAGACLALALTALIWT